MNSMIAQFIDLKDRIEKDLTGILRSEVEEAFQQFPELASVHFSAHRPTFNDGDACLYNIDSLDVGFVSKQDKALHVRSDSYRSDDDHCSDYCGDSECLFVDTYNLDKTSTVGMFANQFYESLSEMGEMIETALGNVKVTFTREGMETEEVGCD